MRVITIKPKWANKIHNGEKLVENRSWKCQPGWLLLHSGQPEGMILGAMHITGFIDPEKSDNYLSLPYYEGPVDNGKINYGWIISEYIPLKNPIENVKGKLSIWQYNDEDKILNAF